MLRKKKKRGAFDEFGQTRQKKRQSTFGQDNNAVDLLGPLILGNSMVKSYGKDLFNKVI